MFYWHWTRNTQIGTSLNDGPSTLTTASTCDYLTFVVTQFAFFIFAQRSIWHPFLVFRHNCNSREWEASSMCPSREWSPLYHQWHRVSSWLARSKQWNYSFWQPGLFHADSLPVYHYTRLDWCPLLGKLLHRHIYGIEIFMAQTKTYPAAKQSTFVNHMYLILSYV